MLVSVDAQRPLLVWSVLMLLIAGQASRSSNALAQESSPAAEEGSSSSAAEVLEIEENPPSDSDETEEEEEEEPIEEGEFTPTWSDDEEAVEEGEFAPTWSDEEEAVEEGEFAPSWADEEEAVEEGEFAPSWTDEEELSGDEGEFIPVPEEDAAPDAELSDEDLRWLQDDVEVEAAEGEDWEQYWEELQPENVIEEIPLDAPIAEGMGVVTGIVVDDGSSEPVYGAEITFDGLDLTQTTGEPGQFWFELEPGTYVMRVRNLSYIPSAYEVLIEPDATTDMAEIRLRLDDSRSMVVVVEGRADQNSVATAMMERREQTAMTNAISAEEMTRTPDSSASAAVGRVVGVSVIDDQFVFVRGLGGRYTRVMFNGISVPNTDPDFPSASLDLFPAGLLANLTLLKTGTPDQPGDYTGGLVDIASRAYPEEFTLELGVSLSGDTQTTFRRSVQDQAGSLDWLGFDDGNRAIPAEVPDNIRVDTGGEIDSAELENIAESFRNEWLPSERLLRPNLTLQGQAGDLIETQRAGKLGYLLSFRYSNRMERRGPTIIRNVTLDRDGEGVTSIESLEAERIRNRVLWGLLGTMTWTPAERHDLSLVTMWNQSGNGFTEVVEGEADEEADFIRRTQLQWIQRSVLFTQLMGAHRGLPVDSDIEWKLAWSRAVRDEPDTRFLVQVGDGLIWRPNPGSGERFFAAMEQQDWSGGLDWTLRPSLNLTLKAGTLNQFSERTFDSRRFRYRVDSFDTRTLPADEIFTPENIGETVFISEVTQATDSYGSTQRTHAGFGMFDWNLSQRFRVIAGARYESFIQTIEAQSRFAQSGAAVDDERRVDNDVMPSGSFVVTLQPERMFLRTAYSLSVARPQVREIAPFVFQDYVRRRTVTGNPDLERTLIHNGDIRWEWFPTRTELFAVTLFVKQFEAPIESLLVDVRGNVSYANVESATNLGAEFEGRYSFGNLHDRLEGMTIGANVALVRSRVRLPECDPIRSTDTECAAPSYTNTDRPLAGQSPWAVNAVLGYEPPSTGFGAFLYYNVLGPRIEDVGGLGLPDIYQLAPHRVDFTAQYDFNDHWRGVFAATNLLNQDVTQEIGDVVLIRQPLGVGFSLGIRWSY